MSMLGITYGITYGLAIRAHLNTRRKSAKGLLTVPCRHLISKVRSQWLLEPQGSTNELGVYKKGALRASNRKRGQSSNVSSQRIKDGIGK